MHYGIITKKNSSSVIINDYMIKLSNFYKLEISEVLTQHIRSNHTNILHKRKLTTTGEYDLYGYTKYKISDHLTTTQLNKPKDIHRQILTDDTIGCID